MIYVWILLVITPQGTHGFDEAMRTQEQCKAQGHEFMRVKRFKDAQVQCFEVRLPDGVVPFKGEKK